MKTEFWCSILELVRTHFAPTAVGARKSPRESASWRTKRRRLVLSEVEVSRTADSFPATFFNFSESGIPRTAVTSFSLAVFKTS